MTALPYILLNGKIVATDEAKVPIDNGAFRYGHGVFETMLVLNGQIRLINSHLVRLFLGMAALDIQVPFIDHQTIEDDILRIVKKNNAEQLCRVRLQVFAGGGGLFAHEQKGGYIVECFPLEKSTLSLNENGLVTGIETELRKSADILSRWKTCNALVYALAAKKAMSQKWNDTLICNTHGNVIESTIANIFWIKNGNVFTPPDTEGCVAGVMRDHVKTALYNVTEAPLSPETLADADEVFLSNAIRGIRWVASVDDTRYGNKKVQEIHALISKGMIL